MFRGLTGFVKSNYRAITISTWQRNIISSWQLVYTLMLKLIKSKEIKLK